MRFAGTGVVGAFLVDLTELSDERGFFARSFCQREFEERGLNPKVAQCNVSFNRHAGTLRGMHSQAAPHEEAKLVRCTLGAVHDVLLDLRPTSPSFLRHVGVTLSAENRTAVYIPEGVFHGFLTLQDDTEVFYQMSEFYVPGQALGVRWDDPAFRIAWPGAVRVISERDRTYPDFAPPAEARHDR